MLDRTLPRLPVPILVRPGFAVLFLSLAPTRHSYECLASLFSLNGFGAASAAPQRKMSNPGYICVYPDGGLCAPFWVGERVQHHSQATSAQKVHGTLIIGMPIP